MVIINSKNGQVGYYNEFMANRDDFFVMRLGEDSDESIYNIAKLCHMSDCSEGMHGCMSSEANYLGDNQWSLGFGLQFLPCPGQQSGPHSGS